MLIFFITPVLCHQDGVIWLHQLFKVEQREEVSFLTAQETPDAGRQPQDQEGGPERLSVSTLEVLLHLPYKLKPYQQAYLKYLPCTRP